MYTYTSTPSNPIAPAQFSLYVVIPVLADTNFVFPTSFPPYVETQIPLAAVVIFEDDGTTPGQYFLPDATLGALGYASNLLNLTEDPVVLKSPESETEVVTIPVGECIQIVLTDNSTKDGGWQAIPLGAAASPIDAAQLAGGGLIAVSTRLNTNIDVIAATTFPSSWEANDCNNLFAYNGAGNYTWTLPSPVPFDGFMFYVKNSTSGNGLLTINAPVGGTINDQPSLTLTKGQTAYLISDDLAWITFGTNGIENGGVRITANGIQVVAGSASVPSFTFIPYSTTGLFSTSASNLSVTIEENPVGEFVPQGYNSDTANIYWGGINIQYLAGLYP